MVERKSELSGWMKQELAEIDKEIEASRLRKEKATPPPPQSDYGSQPHPNQIRSGKKPR